MPAKKGRTVQLQIVRTVPDTDATAYATTRCARAPRYRMMEPLETNVAMAPAMSIAGRSPYIT